MRVILIAAQSVDGRITRGNTEGSGFASAEDALWFRRTLAGMDAVLMGRRTYEAAREKIRSRHAPAPRRIIFTRQPERYQSEAAPGIEFSDDPPSACLQRLAAEGLREIALVGGADLHTQFLQARLVHEVWITLEPWIFGSGRLLAPDSPETALRLLSCEALSSQVILLKYAVST